MEIIEFNQNWKMRCVEDADWQEAEVPGTVYTDLLRNGKMEDPYWKDNEDDVCALMEKDYEYVCTFEGGRTEGYTGIFLRFEGLDNVADLYLNDRFLGQALNMHRVWEYEVSDLLCAGKKYPAGGVSFPARLYRGGI